MALMRFIKAIWTFGTLISVAGACYPQPAEAAELDYIRRSGIFNICANPEALPYTSESDIRGFQLELHEAIAKEMGWQSDVKWVYDRISARYAGCGGFMGRIITANKLPTRNSLNTAPYMGTGYVIVLPRGSKTEYKNLEELLAEGTFQNGGKIGITIGAWIGGIVEKNGVKSTPFLKQRDIIEGVLSGEVAAGIVAREDTYWYLKGNPDQFAIFELYKTNPMFRWNVGMGMRNADQPLVDILSETLAKLVKNQTLQNILRNYGIEYIAPFPD